METRKARVAGGLYLAMLPFAVYAMYSKFSVYVAGDNMATLENSQNLGVLVASGAISWLVVQVLQILLALALYDLFKPVSASAAHLMIAFIFVAIPISMVGELFTLASLEMSGFDEIGLAQRAGLVGLLWHLNETGTIICHLLWGLWLFPLGYLVIKSGFLPRMVGLLVMVAGAGYLVDFLAFLVLSGGHTPVTPVTFIGELALAVSLLICQRNKGSGVRPLQGSASVDSKMAQ